MTISTELNDLIRREHEREALIHELEAQVNSLTAALTGNTPVESDNLFDLIPPDRISDSLTVSQVRAAWRKGLLLNISESARATKRGVATMSAYYRYGKDYLPSIRMTDDTASRNNRTTLIYIGWLAAKWPDGPGTIAWRKGRAAYEEWVKDNLDRPT